LCSTLFPYTTLFRSIFCFFSPIAMCLNLAKDKGDYTGWPQPPRSRSTGPPVNLHAPAPGSGTTITRGEIRPDDGHGNRQAAPPRSEEHTSELQSREN